MSLTRLLHLLDLFTEKTGHFLSWLNVLMVIFTFCIVVMRYAFHYSPIAVQESIMYMHAMIFMLASAYTLKHDEHVRVDIFYQKFSAKGKACINLFGSLFLLLPTILFIGYISWPYVESAWQIKETSQEAAGLPLVYLLKSLIIAMTVLMSLQGLTEILRQFGILFGLDVPGTHHDGDMI